MLFKRLGEEMVLFNLDTITHELDRQPGSGNCWPDTILHQSASDIDSMVDRDRLASEAEALLASLQQEGLVSSGE